MSCLTTTLWLVNTPKSEKNPASAPCTYYNTRKPRWCKGNARQRHHSKMAVSRHIGFYRTGNSTIWSDPENPKLEPNMEWIGCTVCEIFAFKLYCDLETGVRGHSRSSKVALFDRAHTTLYSSSIVTMPLSYLFRDIATYWSKIATPLVFDAPVGVKPSDLCNYPWWRKTRMIDLSDSKRISMMRSAVLPRSTHVTALTDG